MSTTLELFWNLSSSSKKERIDASVKLLSALDHFQSLFVAQSNSSDDEDQDEAAEDNLDTFNAQDVSYSIRRLVRGLASPRESSRLGFAVALTELLSRLHTVTCSQIVLLILDSSKPQGSMTGQEERDMLFARLFGLSSVIQSGLLVRDTPLPSSSTATSSLPCYEQVINCLIDLGEKKSWLRESAWWTISVAIDVLNGSNVTWKRDAVGSTINALYKDDTSWTPEKIALTLKLRSLYPKQKWNALLLPTFKNSDILSTGNLGILAKILKESYTSDEEETVSVPTGQTGSWKPQVHFVWDILLDILLPGPNSTASSQGSIQEFWRIVVDESLFSSTSSPERKYWGFQIFQKTLPRINQSSDLPMLFTKNFMRSWINHLSKSDRHLHKAARAVAVDMQTVVQKNPTIGFTLVLQLTGVHGSRQFDSLTKTKTVESILLSMNADGITNYIEYLLGQINDDGTSDIQVILSKRSWVICQLSSLIRNSSIPKTDQWIQTILDWLVIHGLFVVVKKNEKSAYVGMRSIPKPPLSDGLRKECRMKLLSSLADLTTKATTVKSEDEKTTKLHGVSSTGEFWISRVLATIRTLEQMPKHVTLLYPIDDEDDDGNVLLEKAWGALESLKAVTSGKKEAARGAELLLSATILQRFCSAGDDVSDPEDGEGSDSNDLLACIDGSTRLFAVTTGKKRKSASQGSKNGDKPEPIDVLVDTIIGFLEKATSYMRTVANQAFGSLSEYVTGNTIDLILTQLEHRNPSHDIEDDNEEIQDVEDEDDQEVSSSTSEDGDDDAEDSNDEEPDLELRKKIEEALRANGIEAATGDSGDSSDEDKEDMMDDDQMMAIDEHLAEVFRSRTSERKGGKDVNAQREATHFKNRVLDLIEIYIKKQPTSPYIMRFILPIVDLTVGSGSGEKQLSDKATGVLRSRIGKLKEVPSELKLEDVTLVLQEVHSRARRAHSPEDIVTLNQCSLYLVRALDHFDNSEPVIDSYRESLKDFITRKASRLNTAFFQDFISRNPEIAWNLRNDFLSFVDPGQAVNSYRQCQAFQLMNALLTRLPVENDHQQELFSFMPKLQHVLSSLISSACSEESSQLTAVQLKDVLKLAVTAIRQTKRSVSNLDDLFKIWDSSIWDKVHDQLVKSDRFGKSTGLHAMCKQIRDIASGPNTEPRSPEKKRENEIKQVKRKAEEITAAEEEIDLPKKIKRKKTKAKP